MLFGVEKYIPRYYLAFLYIKYDFKIIKNFFKRRLPSFLSFIYVYECIYNIIEEKFPLTLNYEKLTYDSNNKKNVFQENFRHLIDFPSPFRIKSFFFK